VSRVICIPSFSETGEIVLVNLSTLESELVRFQAGTVKKIEGPVRGEEDTAMRDIEEL
jgi:DNA polymerase II small subunit/DNA polymerase delta subunit B